MRVSTSFVESFSTIANSLPLFAIELVPATRFGAKPAHPNTFLNHQAGPNTPGFINETDRFQGMRSNRNLQTKCDFQQEEKMKRKAI